jgi:hypothetical protein
MSDNKPHEHSGVSAYQVVGRECVVDAASRSGNGTHVKTTSEGIPRTPVSPAMAIPLDPNGRPLGTGQSGPVAPISALRASIIMKNLEGK